MVTTRATRVVPCADKLASATSPPILWSPLPTCAQPVAARYPALAAKAVAGFVAPARPAWQDGPAAQWHVPSSRVTIPEIRTRLNGHGEAVSAVFKTADEIAYSGRRFTAPDLKEWRDLVENELHQLARI